MPAPGIGSIIEIKLYSQFRTQVAINVSHWRVKNTAGLGATLAAIAAGMSTVFADDLRQCLNQESTYRGASAQVVGLAPSMIVYSNEGSGVGTGGLEPEASQAAGLFKLVTGLPGRTNRGRKYIPFMSEADVTTDGLLSAGYTADLTTLATLFTNQHLIVSGADTTTLEPVIYHRSNGTGTLVIGHVVRNYPATQRRRSLGKPDGPSPI